MSRSQLSRRTDPRQSDNEKDLGEREIAQPQLLLEVGAVRGDIRLRAPQIVIVTRPHASTLARR